jgi:hypothetical protein
MTTAPLTPSTEDEVTDARRGRRRAVMGAVLAALVVAAGVGFFVGERKGESADPLVDVVTCSVWTRPNDRQQPTLAGNLRIDWGTASKAEGVSSEQKASGNGLTLSAQYAFPYPPEGHTLSIRVSDSKGRVVHLTTFQIWQGPSDIFGQSSGGFTGLNYAFDADTGAEMQYSCAVA